jgi:hypothetical protein
LWPCKKLTTFLATFGYFWLFLAVFARFSGLKNDDFPNNPTAYHYFDSQRCNGCIYLKKKKAEISLRLTTISIAKTATKKGF